MNNEKDRYLLDDKFETYKLLSQYYKRDMIFVKDSSDFSAFVEFVTKHPVCVVKPTDATYGQGVYKLTVNTESNLKDTFDSLFIKNNNTERETLVKSKGVLLEELIIQDERLAVLHPNSVQCLRCNTLFIDDETNVIATSMKVGVGNQFVTSIGGGSLTIGINKETGIMDTNGFSEIFGMGEIAIHPDTKITFKGFSIPQWAELLSLVNKIAEKFPTIKYIAWDLALSNKGWCVIEGNYAGDFNTIQLPYKQGIKSKFEEILGWKPTEKFWWQTPRLN